MKHLTDATLSDIPGPFDPGSGRGPSVLEVAMGIEDGLCTRQRDDKIASLASEGIAAPRRTAVRRTAL